MEGGNKNLVNLELEKINEVSYTPISLSELEYSLNKVLLNYLPLLWRLLS